MTLPSISSKIQKFREDFSLPKFFRLTYLKKHHFLFALELGLLSLVGLILAFSIQTIVTHLLTKPSVVASYPQKSDLKAEVSSPINITFSNPVDQASLKASIVPKVDGVWEFSSGVVNLLKTELVFRPETTLQPDTEYSVNIDGIKPVISGSKTNYSYKFRTKKLPSIVSAENQTLGPNDSFVVNLDTANTFMADFKFSFEPNVDFDQTQSPNKKQYFLKPKTALKQGSTYQLTTQKTAIIYNLKTGKKIESKKVIYDLKTKKVVELNQPSPEKSLTFTTLAQPTIPSISASGTAASTGPITVVFDKDMDKFSVANSLQITPTIEHTLSWSDNKNLIVTPNQKLPYNTNYQLTFVKGMSATDSTFLETNFVHQFTTIGNVKVTQFTPSNGAGGVAVGSKIYTTFDQAVDRQSAQIHFSITPAVTGTFSWNQNIMIFSPAAAFPYSTGYTVTISKGVKSLTALDSVADFKTSFTTASLYEVVKLSVPIVKQKYTLSCEFANMKMVLAYRGINKSEDELIAETPFDNTPHSGDVWGDPALGFLGNVNGTYFGDGYGAYYPVIVNELSKYRPAEAHVGWNVSALLSEIKAGNPVIIWSCLVCRNPRYWNTPDSRQIYAYEYYHMMTVVGYTGTVDNPQSIILNDSYSGKQISYSKSQFSSRWSIMNNTAVVVK